MSGLLPEKIEPVRLARVAGVLRGGVPLSRLSRLAELTGQTDVQGRVDLDLSFDLGPRRACLVNGTLSAIVDLPCQRCLRMMPCPVHVDVRLASCRDGHEDSLPQGYDRLMTVEGWLQLYDLVEDELILALPIVAMHPLEACAVGDAYRKEILVTDLDLDQDLQRPFSGLADLLARKRDDQG